VRDRRSTASIDLAEYRTNDSHQHSWNNIHVYHTPSI